MEFLLLVVEVAENGDVEDDHDQGEGVVHEAVVAAALGAELSVLNGVGEAVCEEEDYGVVQVFHVGVYGFGFLDLLGGVEEHQGGLGGYKI